MTYKDPDYMKKWRLANHDKILASARKHRAKNRAKYVEYGTNWRKNNREKYNEYRKELHRRKTDSSAHYRELRRIQSTKQRLKNPTRSTEMSRASRLTQKGKARVIFSNAIADGKIKKVSVCSKCGSTRRVQGHHPDYYKPLEVMWLCQLCHGKEHRT